MLPKRESNRLAKKRAVVDEQVCKAVLYSDECTVLVLVILYLEEYTTGSLLMSCILFQVLT